MAASGAPGKAHGAGEAALLWAFCALDKSPWQLLSPEAVPGHVVRAQTGWALEPQGSNAIAGTPGQAAARGPVWAPWPVLCRSLEPAPRPPLPTCTVARAAGRPPLRTAHCPLPIWIRAEPPMGAFTGRAWSPWALSQPRQGQETHPVPGLLGSQGRDKPCIAATASS